jgi:hypothetical protein
MGTDHIRYDLLAQDALRGVVKRVLADAARDGLPGEHHFYISFKTQHPGVRLSQRLAEKYPDEITIVLQHQFWDLSVGDNGFEVGLSFGNAPEKLVVPFDAVSGFFDPSVQFGLKFEVVTSEPEVSDVAPSPPPVLAPLRPAIRGAASEPDEAPALAKPAKAAKGEGGKGEKKAQAKPLKVVAPSEDAQDKGGEAEKVVSLDTFRKKK